MKLLVTGAAGFVGHHFVEHVLRNTTWSVTGVASFRHHGCPLRLHHLIMDKRYGDRLRLVYAELSAPITSRLDAEIGAFDVIVNFASESHVDRSIASPRLFVENNSNLMLTVLELARQRNQRLLHVSTDEVYGAAPNGIQHVEWSSILPSNPYAASKALQEALAIAWWRTYGLPLQIVNSMNLIGERQDPEKFLPLVIRSVWRGEEVPIHGNSSVIGSRMYLHARNLADAIVWLLASEPSLYPSIDRPDRWNVVGEREINNLELAELVASIMDRPLRYRLVDFHSARPGHDRRYALDGTKIREAGWRQPRVLEASLEKTVRWTIDHPQWMI